MTVVAPIVIGVLYVLLNSLIREPHRRRFNAIMVAGAGAAYLSGGGFGLWEFAFTIVITYCAYRGLESWTFIGIAWLLHTVWDVLHHLHGHPIIPFAQHSSLGCAICDPVIAAWCLTGGPSATDTLRDRFSRARQHQVDINRRTPRRGNCIRALARPAMTWHRLISHLQDRRGQLRQSLHELGRPGGCGECSDQVVRPSWRSMPSSSLLPQRSTSFPSTNRLICMPR